MVFRSVQQIASGDKPTCKHTWVSFNQISPHLPMAVIASEDNRFAEHNGFDLKEIEKAIKENPDAVAVLVNNPTYYGICSDLRAIVKLAHAHNMLVLVDEAHGTHLYFGENLPVCAMDAGADMASVSMH